MGDYTISYLFSFPDGRAHAFDVHMDPKTLAFQPAGAAEGPPPAWTALACQQCTNCPLDSTHSHCPLALSLVDLVQLSADLMSYDAVHIEVRMPARHIVKDTTLQRGIASLMGLLIATSECPHTRIFRPMARFHLPLATEEETIYRATSSYLLSQYFAQQRGLSADLSFDGLVEAYEAMHTINMHIARRLREAVQKDSSLNALILLDLFSKALPDTIEDSLEEVRYLFEPYLSTL